MAKVDNKNWLLLGAIAAGITPMLMKVLAMIPMFQVTFSTIALNIRSKITGVSGLDFGNYVLGLIGQDFGIPAMALNIIGGAALVLLARYALDYIPFKPKNKQQKLIAVFVIAAVGQLLLLSGFGIPSINILLGFLINAIAMAYIVNFLADQFSIKVS